MGGSARFPEGKTGEQASFRLVEATELGLDEQTRLSRADTKAGRLRPPPVPPWKSILCPHQARPLTPGGSVFWIWGLSSNVASADMKGAGRARHAFCVQPLPAKEPALDLTPLTLDPQGCAWRGREPGLRPELSQLVQAPETASLEQSLH